MSEPPYDTLEAPFFWSVVTLVDDGAALVDVFEPEAELSPLADGHPTPLYVARMMFAACSARPYVGA